MTDPNRLSPDGGPILSLTSPPPAPPPGSGGWVPPAWAPWVAALGGGVATSVADAMLAACPTAAVACALPPWQLLLGAAIKGLAVGALGFLGMRSAGPRKTE